MKYYSIILFVLLLSNLNTTTAQDSSLTRISDSEYFGTTTINGYVVKILVINGDTLPVVDLDFIQVSQVRSFKNRNERKLYNQWRTYAAKVYPYAAEAVHLYRQHEAETKDMRKRKRRKSARKKEKSYRPKYEKELKNLTKTQGYILIKMIERELDAPFYQVIRELEGRWAAFKWQAMGRWYGFNLKSGYDPKDNPMLEIILDDLNISYSTSSNVGVLE